MAAAIPVLGALALGAQRLLPLLHASYVGWTQFSGHLQTLRDVVALMHAPIVTARAGTRPAPFQHDIVFDRVGLAHPGGAQALREVSFVSPRASGSAWSARPARGRAACSIC